MRSGLDAFTPVSMFPRRTPAPVTPYRVHTARALIWSNGSCPTPATDPSPGATTSGVDNVGASTSPTATVRSRSTSATAAMRATSATRRPGSVTPRALVIQNRRAGTPIRRSTAGWLRAAVERSARSRACGRPAYRDGSTWLRRVTTTRTGAAGSAAIRSRSMGATSARAVDATTNAAAPPSATARNFRPAA
jgi:hypothetical protein